MALETRCPACGAPLVFSGNQDAVRCTFCGTDLKIVEENGQAQFRVLSQPEPQKEILDQPVESARIMPGELLDDPGIPPVVAGVADESFPAQPVSTGAAAYPVHQEPAVSKGVSRWVWVGIALLVGLVVLCACVVMAAILFLFPAGL